MTPFLPPVRLTGADILRQGRIERGCLSLAQGCIVDAPLLPVDLSGFLLLPGIIDLHGDGFERQIFPRPSAPFPIRSGLIATDREAAANGVTTAFLAQSWSWEGGIRGPDQAEALLAEVAAYREQALVDLRVQLRAETHMVDQADRLAKAVQGFGVGYVIFNDHLGEGFLMQRRDPARFAHWAQKVGLTAEALLARMETARARTRDVPRTLCHLAAVFDQLGAIYGSHDDPDAETREFYSMIGARVAEFPTRRRAAAAAHAVGDPVLMGAPNVVRGGSQAGNIGAEDLIREGLCDALVSDYHIPALPLAVWGLVDRGVLPLEKAWAMVSEAPADILRLSDRGRLMPGLRADLVAVNARTRAVELTISGGRLAYLAGEAAQRFLSRPPIEAHAVRLAAE